MLVRAGPPARKIVLNQLPAMIGRDAAADVCLEDSWVSHFQCIIDQDGTTLQVLDLGSRNGTFVNGVRIKRADLMPGNTLTVGRGEFVVQYERDPGRPSAQTKSPETVSGLG
jgi:pSer/pThr/pTyr-binding forkhead associated (FHA) protein